MNDIPNWKERQRLLYSKGGGADPAKLKELAESALAKGYVQDAFEYFRGAKDAGGMEKIKKLAVEEGDPFLLDAVEKQSEAPFSADEWNQVGYRAFELGKYAFARRAFERTANELMLAKVRATSDDSPST